MLAAQERWLLELCFYTGLGCYERLSNCHAVRMSGHGWLLLMLHHVCFSILLMQVGNSLFGPDAPTGSPRFARIAVVHGHFVYADLRCASTTPVTLAFDHVVVKLLHILRHSQPQGCVDLLLPVQCYASHCGLAMCPLLIFVVVDHTLFVI
jgi:hypothetical protein